MISMSPDAYTRFLSVNWALKKINKGKLTDKDTVLDIGGSSPHLFKSFIEHNNNPQLTIIDPLPKPKGLNKSVRYVVGSAADLSMYSDNEFDYVTMVDVLEHIPGNGLKNKVLSEATRVARKGIVFAGPTQTKKTDEYETTLNNLNKKLFGFDQEWLKEHFECGKPNESDVKNEFKSAGFNVVSFSNLPFSFWLSSSVANMMKAVTYQKAAKTRVEALNKHFNASHKNDYGRFTVKDGYRKVIIASKNVIKVELAPLNEYDVYEQMYVTEPLSVLSDMQKAVSAENQKINSIHSEEITKLMGNLKSVNSRYEDILVERNELLEEKDKLKAWKSKVQGSKTYRIFSGIKRLVKAITRR